MGLFYTKICTKGCGLACPDHGVVTNECGARNCEYALKVRKSERELFTKILENQERILKQTEEQEEPMRQTICTKLGAKCPHAQRDNMCFRAPELCNLMVDIDNSSIEGKQFEALLRNQRQLAQQLEDVIKIIKEKGIDCGR